MTELSPMMQLRARFEDKCGHPLIGGSVFAFEVGTSTPKDTYADAAGTKPNTHPIKLDYRGEADIFLLPGRYRFVVYSKSGALIYDVDDVGDWLGSSISDQIVITEDGTTQRSFNTLTKTGSANKFDPAIASKGYYDIGSVVRLNDGTEVISTIDNNQNNPNLNMTGWDYINVAMNKTYPPVLNSPVKFKLNPFMASFIYGISDPTHKDDDLNNFRGLNNPDAYHDSNVAIGAVSFGRNNPPFAYLSLAGGHDCVPFGVASFVLGAGSCTGNPDDPVGSANGVYGYCSLAVGKNTQARGRISNAMGERCLSESRYSSTDGYKCIAGKTQPTHPNYNLYGEDGAEGAASRAHGFVSQAYGNFSFAYGSMLAAYNGAQVIGKGINEGSPLIISKRGLGLGYNVDVPTIFCQGGVGANGAHAPIGFNTDSPRNKYHFALKSGDTFNYVIDEVGSNETVFSQETVGKLSNGDYASLHNIVTYHTNENVASAIVEYRLNSTPYLKVDQSLNADFSAAVNVKTGFYYNGVKVVGQRQAAIAKLPNNASLADVIAKMNEIIEGVTNHGLFATPT
ncbi:hypothetical protein [Acinetobacter nosocomialis]|uniref:hypothetical protein n=1 Tax=Acinetobacter nosocomialis TaxID=106654 RepID=UPI001250C1E3|nr:hypothetical protein [Acinetobacter nosocomialis]